MLGWSTSCRMQQAEKLKDGVGSVAVRSLGGEGLSLIGCFFLPLLNHFMKYEYLPLFILYTSFKVLTYCDIF